MTGLDTLGGVAMVQHAFFAKLGHLIDVGCGRGHFLTKIWNRHPATTDVLFDQLETIAEVKKNAWAVGGEFGHISRRAQLVGGSFFQECALPKAQAPTDVFVLSCVLHDWRMKETLAILKSVQRAVGTSGDSMLIGEFAILDPDSVGVPPAMYDIDLQMLVLFGTEAHGRTPMQWHIHPTRSLGGRFGVLLPNGGSSPPTALLPLGQHPGFLTQSRIRAVHETRVLPKWQSS